MANKPVSVAEFKNWFSSQADLSEFFNIGLSSGQEDPEDKYVGVRCRSKVSEQKLLEKVQTEDDPEEVVREFVEAGGTVLAVEGKNLQIEVSTGTLTLPRFCVKVRKPQ